MAAPAVGPVRSRHDTPASPHAPGTRGHRAGPIPDRLAEVLDLHGIPRSTIEHETAALTPQSLTTTANRSLVGVLNEFTHLAAAWRDPAGHDDLNDLSLRLARVPCNPLYQRHVSPDHELAGLLTHPRPG